MFRSIITAIGVFLLILGGESLIVDRVIVVASPQESAATTATAPYSASPFQNAGFSQQLNPARPRRIHRRVYYTKDWMPWSLLAAGTIVVLYSYSINPSQRNDS